MLNENKEMCWLCEEESADSSVGIVHLEIEGRWNREKERKTLFWFHKKCFEEQSEIISTQSTTVCLFCNINVGKLYSKDLVIRFPYRNNIFGNYYVWIHGKCWNKYGISLD